MPVKLATLLTNTVVGVDLYLMSGQDQRLMLYRGLKLPFTEEHRVRLLDAGIGTLYIQKVDRRAYYRYIENNLPTIIGADDIPESEKVEALFYSACELTNEIFANPASKETFRRSESFVADTVDYMVSRQYLHQLLQTVPAEYFVNTHSVTVCGITTPLAGAMGVEGADLVECGCGALLHDVGKSVVHPDILNSRKKLDETQMRQVRRHPQEGLKLLGQIGDISPGVHAVVLEHHETHDGTGYPGARKGTETHLYARIVHVADVFAALTANRPYASAVGTFTALSIMTQEMRGKLDPLVLRKFVQILAR